jgi:hypothetical protein
MAEWQKQLDSLARRHADHDPGLICRPAFGMGLCELLEDVRAMPERPRPPDIQPWFGNPWCSKCQATIRRELAELDDLAALLAALPPGIRPAVTGQREHVKVSGTHGHPSPSDTVEALDELAGWLRDWEGAVRGADTMARRGYLASQITTSVAWLLAQFDTVIIHPDLAADFGAETRRWHRELTAASHAGSAAKHVKKPCPRCRLFTLWEDLGADYIRCVNDECQRRLTRAELEAEKESVPYG